MTCSAPGRVSAKQPRDLTAEPAAAHEDEALRDLRVLVRELHRDTAAEGLADGRHATYRVIFATEGTRSQVLSVVRLTNDLAGTTAEQIGRSALCAGRGWRSLAADGIEKRPRLPPRTEHVHRRVRPEPQDLGTCVLRF